MRETTLVHIVRDGCVLMMHRISKEHDINHGKWIGVGGKFEKGETPEECMRREVREETGLKIDQYRYCGIVTFVSDDDETEYMHLFTVTGFHDPRDGCVRDGRSVSESMKIELKECSEGQLEWLPKEELTRIPHWAGDRIFLPLILDAEIPFFSMKLVYRKGELIHASMNEHNCLVTDRLILRPWLLEDAAALFRHVKNPNIGPRAGWPAHTDVAFSRESIRTILTRPEIYAIVLRDTEEPIGSVGLQNFRLVDADGSLLTFFDERKSENPLICTMPGDAENDMSSDVMPGNAENNMRNGMSSDVMPGDAENNIRNDMSSDVMPGDAENDTEYEKPDQDSAPCRIEAALGYWLAEPYWHQGIMTEAAGALLDHARKDLGIRRVWADYYEGNEASGRVMERLQFHFHHIEKDRYVEPLKERRTAIVYVKDLDTSQWGDPRL